MVLEQYETLIKVRYNFNEEDKEILEILSETDSS